MLLPLFLVSEVVSAAEVNNLGLTGTETGVFTVLLFMIAYGFV